GGDDALDAADEPPVKDERVRPLFLDTLRRQLPAEQQRRADIRAAELAAAQRKARERAEREARVRETPPYRELAEFVVDLRKQYLAEKAALDKRERALTRLFQELNINDAEERDRLRKQ